MATHVSRPVQSFYCATVRAAIWRNEGTRGAFHAITLSRTFMDAEGHIRRAQAHRCCAIHETPPSATRENLKIRLHRGA